MPESSPPPAVAEGDENEDAEYSEDDFMAEGRRDAAPEMDRSAFASSLMSSTRGMKRSRNGRPKEQTVGDYGAIAKSMAGRSQTKLDDPDDLILRQEDTIHRMDELANANASGRDAAVEEGVVDLVKLWGQHAQMETKEAGLGPVAEDDITRANYLSSLLLQLHHPHAVKGSQQQTRPHHALSGARKANSAGNTTIPRALLDWLNTYHIPFPDDYDTVWRYQPSPSAHERFWDAVYYSLIRGKYDQAIRLLSDAGWDNALTDEEDTDGTRFSERQLDHIEHVVEACITLLRTCPALKYSDWNVKGNDWAVFRQRARTALRNLESYAGEPDEDDEQDELGASRGGGNVFNQSHSMAMSAASRRAESKVPWSIYENLKLLYSVVLGDVDALCDTSQDWLEASIYLTVWWDGEAGDPTEPASLRASQSMRKSLTGSKRAKTREVDVAPGTAYRKRLAEAFVLVVDTGEDVVFQPDTLDPVQVGLACIFTENVEAIIALLRSWSLPITSGVVEVAGLGGWMPHARPGGKDGLLQRGFSSEDLMVLSHGPASNQSQSGEMERDEVLSGYAEALAKKQLLKSTDGKIEREGWELAVEVLGRLGDTKVGEQKVREVLEGLDLEGEGTVDKVLSACRSLSLDEEARGIAEVRITAQLRLRFMTFMLTISTALRRHSGFLRGRRSTSLRFGAHLLRPGTRRRQAQGPSLSLDVLLSATLGRVPLRHRPRPPASKSPQQRPTIARRTRARRSRRRISPRQIPLRLRHRTTLLLPPRPGPHPRLDHNPPTSRTQTRSRQSPCSRHRVRSRLHPRRPVRPRRRKRDRRRLRAGALSRIPPPPRPTQTHLHQGTGLRPPPRRRGFRDRAFPDQGECRESHAGFCYRVPGQRRWGGGW